MDIVPEPMDIVPEPMDIVPEPVDIVPEPAPEPASKRVPEPDRELVPSTVVAATAEPLVADEAGEGPSPARSSPVAPVRRHEYRQLFARLRRG
jgi:hypothetical protein